MPSRVDLARVLVRLYPRRWRERYGDEFLALIGEHGLDWRKVLDVIRAAGDEWAALAVRRLMGSEREDAVIRRIARWVVQIVLAWAAAITVSAVFPVGAALVGVALRICGWNVVHHWVVALPSRFMMLSTSSSGPVFLLALLVLTSPVVIAFKVTRAGRMMPWTARIATIAVVLLVDVLWNAWWSSYSAWWGLMSLGMLDSLLSVGAGGSVIACALFPRAPQPSAPNPPRLAPA